MEQLPIADRHCCLRTFPLQPPPRRSVPHIFAARDPPRQPITASNRP